jgi:hypothetical protein
MSWFHPTVLVYPYPRLPAAAACKKLRIVMTSPDKLLTLQQHLLTFELGNLSPEQAFDIAAEELPAATKVRPLPHIRLKCKPAWLHMH